MAFDITVIAYCDMCEAIATASEIGETCSNCEMGGIYDEYWYQACDIGDDCTNDLHVFGYDAHIGSPGEFAEFWEEE